MERVGVVTAVVMAKDGKILFLRRSQKVGSYRGRWACVSGHIESDDRSPLDRALKELEEEVSLKRSDIAEIREGEVQEVIDRNMERIWEVHPFLVILREGAEENIKIDWEHTEIMWSYSVPDNTVPELDRTVELAKKGRITDIHESQSL